MLDLTNECEQREFARGPVPEGSIVMVEIEILKPNQERQAHDNPWLLPASGKYIANSPSPTGNIRV